MIDMQHVLTGFMEEFRRMLPAETSTQDRELLALLLFYRKLRLRDLWQLSLQEQDKTIVQLFETEIQEICQDSRELQGLLQGPLWLLQDKHSSLQVFESMPQPWEQHVSVETFLPFVQLMQLARSEDQNKFKTPEQVCRLTQLLDFRQDRSHFLDLNSSYGEWSGALRSEYVANRRDVKFHQNHFVPFHYLINQMYSRLLPDNEVSNQLSVPYELRADKQLNADVVFVNPPFGKRPAEHNRYETYDSCTYPAWFLQEALNITDRAGQVACLVPVGFLFGKVKKSADYALKVELTREKAIKAVIELPEEVFLPYSRIKTALLLLDYTRPWEKVSFATLTKADYKALPEGLNQLQQFVNGEISGEQVALDGAISKASFAEIEQNGFDWQPQLYHEEVEEQLPPMQEVLRDIQSTEKQLSEVKQQIQSLLLQLDSEEACSPRWSKTNE